MATILVRTAVASLGELSREIRRNGGSVAALAKHISKLPEQFATLLTWDQGKEMNAHKRFTVATNVQLYFCDPRSPWQRGSNENTTVYCVSTSQEGPTSRASLRAI